MSESFLHYVWQFQYFHQHALATAAGEPLQVVNTGMRNTHAGPDFHNARLRIGQLWWAGCVEIHVQASEWYTHHHHHDDAYDAVVLHVVWKNDKPVVRKDGTLLPVLELKDRVDPTLLAKYKKLVSNPEEVACAPHLPDVAPLTLYGMLDKATAIRLERKAGIVKALLRRNKNDWEETAYQLLTQNFGFKVNAEPFLQLAQVLPYRTLMKHADKPASLEALLLGVAGFLPPREPPDDYTRMLLREYKLLAHKYGLQERAMNRAQWKFLRLRPANFPTVRMAQLAAVLGKGRAMFSRLLEAETRQHLAEIFTAEPSPYWQRHYRPGKLSTEGATALGAMSVDNILINTVAPLWVCYGQSKDEQPYVDRALALLHALPPEANTIIRRWKGLDVPCASAFDSQALIELFTGFCSKRRCLDCTIGASLLKPVPT